MRRVFAAAVASAMAFATACSSAPDREPTLVARSGVAMGAPVTVMAWTADQDLANRTFDTVFAEFERLEGLLSTARPDSEISRLNESAGHHPVKVSPDTMKVLAEARDVSDLTAGKFDATAAVLAGGSAADQASIAAKLPLVDYRRVVLDRYPSTAFLQRPEMRVDVSGVARGYAVDRAASLLREAGLDQFSVQAGGDLAVSGRHGNRAWVVGIPDPGASSDDYFARLDLTDRAFGTTSGHEKTLLDPDTGQPSRLARSVTIAATRAAFADALSVGVFVLGPEQGLALVERLRDVEAVIVDAGSRVHVSSGLKDRVAVLREPAGGS